MTDDDVTLEPEDGEGNSESLQAKISKLRDTLAATQKQRDEYLEGWQRTKADYVNLKKRSEDDLVRISDYALQGFLESALPVLDSFDQALSHATEPSPWAEGVKNAYRELLKTLQSAGLEQFDPSGEVFDPKRHEPVETVAVDDESVDNTVVKVHQKGYSLKGRIIRPARVGIGHKNT